jgi:hypothetical protein
MNEHATSRLYRIEMRQSEPQMLLRESGFAAKDIRRQTADQPHNTANGQMFDGK